MPVRVSGYLIVICRVPLVGTRASCPAHNHHDIRPSSVAGVWIATLYCIVVAPIVNDMNVPLLFGTGLELLHD